MAHKKAAGSAKNLRDSNPKYRGVKIFWGQPVVAWNIIIRQKWNKYEAWDNTYVAKDFSIHANIAGVVKFSKRNKLRFDGRKYLKTVVNVVTADAVEVKKPTAKKIADKTAKMSEKATAKPAAKKATASKKPAAKKTVTAKPAAKKTPAKKPAVKKATPVKKATK